MQSLELCQALATSQEGFLPKFNEMQNNLCLCSFLGAGCVSLEGFADGFLLDPSLAASTRGDFPDFPRNPWKGLWRSSRLGVSWTRGCDEMSSGSLLRTARGIWDWNRENSPTGSCVPMRRAGDELCSIPALMGQLWVRTEQSSAHGGL